MHMHEVFNTSSSPLIVGIFLCLLRLDRDSSIEKNQHSLLAILLSTLVNRSHLARVCRDWSELLSKNHTLSLTALHLTVFGCQGDTTEIFARCTILNDFHCAACSLEDDLCRHAIIKFFTLPWRLRVAKLKTFFSQIRLIQSRNIWRRTDPCAKSLLTPNSCPHGARYCRIFYRYQHSN